MKTILVAEDNDSNFILMTYILKRNYQIRRAKNGQEAVEEADNGGIDAVLMDLKMPVMDGLELTSHIRQKDEIKDIPIIMLTAKGEENDQIKGFISGADDYVQKPFSPKVLVARINAILKRNDTSSLNVEVGGIRIDKTAHQVYVDEKPVEFSFKEFELIDYLIENKGIALTREKILNAVWNFDYYGDARTVDTHIKKVRAKLGKKGDYIKTLWGFGYKFECDEDKKVAKKKK